MNAEEIEFVMNLQAEVNSWKRLVGKIGATIPLGETLYAMRDEATFVKYFKELHEERDALKNESKRGFLDPLDNFLKGDRS